MRVQSLSNDLNAIKKNMGQSLYIGTSIKCLYLSHTREWVREEWVVFVLKHQTYDRQTIKSIRNCHGQVNKMSASET